MGQKGQVAIVKVKDFLEDIEQMPQDANVYIRFMESEWEEEEHEPLRRVFVDEEGDVVLTYEDLRR